MGFKEADKTDLGTIVSILQQPDPRRPVDTELLIAGNCFRFLGGTDKNRVILTSRRTLPLLKPGQKLVEADPEHLLVGGIAFSITAVGDKAVA